MLAKLVHHYLFLYMNANSILTPRQGGFPPGFGTSLTASNFVMNILHAQNEGRMTAAIFVDLCKAFDIPLTAQYC